METGGDGDRSGWRQGVMETGGSQVEENRNAIMK